MTRRVCTVAGLLMFTAAVGAAQAPVDATRVAVSAPVAGAEIDAGKMKGDLTRMVPSPDGRSFYFQTVERDTRGNVDVHHFVLAADDKQPKPVNEQPQWAAAFWVAKSAQAAPGIAAQKITVEQERKRIAATPSPVGGDLAKGALGGGGNAGGGATGGSSVGDGLNAANQTQTANVVTLKLMGEVIGEFVNVPAIPGATFGWGPSGTGLIAFVNGSGRLVIMDAEGRKKEVGGAKAVSMPSWTSDGARLFYLERSGRNRFTLKTLDITIPR
jgi:hypothetical protein